MTKFGSIEVIYLFGKHSEHKVISNSNCEIFTISMAPEKVKSKAKIVDEPAFETKTDILLNEKATGK